MDENPYYKITLALFLYNSNSTILTLLEVRKLDESNCWDMSLEVVNGLNQCILIVYIKNAAQKILKVWNYTIHLLIKENVQ